MKVAGSLLAVAVVAAAACNSFGGDTSESPGNDVPAGPKADAGAVDDATASPDGNGQPPDASLADADVDARDAGQPNATDYLLQEQAFYADDAQLPLKAVLPAAIRSDSVSMMLVAARTSSGSTVFPTPTSGSVNWTERGRTPAMGDGVSLAYWTPPAGVDQDLTFDFGGTKCEFAALFLEWKGGDVQALAIESNMNDTATILSIPADKPSIVVNVLAAGGGAVNVTTPAGWTATQSKVGVLGLFGAYRYATTAAPLTTSWRLQASFPFSTFALTVALE